MFIEHASYRLVKAIDTLHTLGLGSGQQIKLIGRDQAGYDSNTHGPGPGRAGIFRPELSTSLNTLPLEQHLSFRCETFLSQLPNSIRQRERSENFANLNWMSHFFFLSFSL